jgi:hypothetical protein
MVDQKAPQTISDLSFMLALWCNTFGARPVTRNRSELARKGYIDTEGNLRDGRKPAGLSFVVPL